MGSEMCIRDRYNRGVNDRSVSVYGSEWLSQDSLGVGSLAGPMTEWRLTRALVFAPFEQLPKILDTLHTRTSVLLVQFDILSLLCLLFQITSRLLCIAFERVVLFDVDVGRRVQVLLNIKVLTLNKLFCYRRSNLDKVVLLAIAT